MLLGVVVGLLIGLIIAVVAKQILPNGDAKRIKELEEEHEKYRQQVDGHFVKTSVLFKGLAEQYRDVYKHMAEGAGQLCSDDAKASQLELADLTLLAEPDLTVDAALDESVESTAGSKIEVPEEEYSQKKDTESGYDFDDDDDLPLAGEVEMSPEMIEQIKNQSSK